MADEEKFGHGPEIMPGRTPDRRPEPDRGPADLAPIRYRPNRWETRITSLSADRMNHIEEGIARVTDLTASLCGRVNGIDASLRYVDEHTGRVKNIFDVLKHQIDGVRDDIDRILHDWGGLIKGFDNTTKRVDEIEKNTDFRCSLVEEKVKNVEEKLKNFDIRAAAIEREFGAVKEEVKRLGESVSDIGVKADDLYKKYAGLLKNLNLLYDKVENLEKAFNEYKEATDSGLNALSEETQALRGDMMRLSHLLEDLSKELDSSAALIQSKLANLSLRIDAVDNKIDSTNQRLDNLEENLDSLIESKVNEILEDGGYITKDDVEAVVDDVISKEDLVTKEDVNDIVNEVIDDKGIVTEGTVREIVDEVIDSKEIVTKETVDEVVEKALEDSDFVTKDYVNDQIDKAISDADFVTNEELNGKGFATETYVENYLVENNYTTVDKVEELISSAKVDTTIDRTDPTNYTVGGCEAGTEFSAETTLKEVLWKILWGDSDVAPVITKIDTDYFVLHGENILTGTADISNTYDAFTIDGVEADIDKTTGEFSVVLSNLTPGEHTFNCIAKNSVGIDTKTITIYVITAAYRTTMEENAPEEVTLKSGAYSKENTINEYSFIQDGIPEDVAADAIYQLRVVEERDKADRNEIHIPSIFDVVGIGVYDNLNGGWYWYQSEDMESTTGKYEADGTRTEVIDGVGVEYTIYRMYDKVLHPLADQSIRVFVKIN